MPLRLDTLDVSLLRALDEDGRKSLRQLAKITKVSTPTVDSRLNRIMQSGLISRIAPIYSVDKLDRGVGALLSLRLDESKVIDVVKKIAPLECVKGIFVTSGEGNLLIKIFCTNYDKIQSFISDQIESIEGVHVISTQMIIKSLKDEQGIVIEPDVGVLLKCDHCDGTIKGDPLIMKITHGERFFCCKTCLQAYQEKYKSKL
jgi:Lrp/AsnC family leucine-responsive transcriptional regulator